MPATRELDPTASPAHFFGAEVRRARIAAGMTLADLAAIVPCDASTVSRIEAGTLSPGQRFPAACDEAFPQMGGWFGRFCHDSLGWAGPHPPWFRDWVETERRATVIRWWEPLLIPGLLQTGDYAREAIFDRESPPEAWILLGEPVLSYQVGDAEVMRKQIEHLAEMAARPQVTIQVIAAGAGAYGGLSGAFAIGTDSTGTVIYLETGVQGMVVRDPRLITRAASMFDHLRAEALPRYQTLDVLAKAGDRWNS
jgi:hypothetical protein